MKVKYFYITFILIIVPNILAQTTVVISNGTRIYIPLGTSFCADTIRIVEGGAYITDDSSGTCPGATITGDGNTSVPVELTSFTASVKDNQVLLKWRTATEVNNYGFEILRYAQDDEWNLLGFVDGHGNSNSPKQYSFTDKNPIGGSVFIYRLKQIDNDGKYEYSDEIEVEIILDEFALYQNYPNPFNPSTKIRYQIPQESKVIIKLYDILGAEVITLLNEKKEPGIYEIDFNAQSTAGGLPSGIYIYRLVADGFIETKKMVLLR